MAAVELALVEAADSELETVRAELRASREHRRKLDRHIGVLEKREALLKVRQKPPRPKKSKAKPKKKDRASRAGALDAHAQAGPKNITLMAETFERLGTATVAEATREAGSEPGHQTWAIRALEEDGVIEQTGRKVGVSVEYRYAKRRRRTTRLGPGK
jgi:hypothetical protein